MRNLSQTQKDFIEGNTIDDSQGKWEEYHSYDEKTYVKKVGEEYILTDPDYLELKSPYKGVILDKYTDIMLKRYETDLDKLSIFDNPLKYALRNSPEFKESKITKKQLLENLNKKQLEENALTINNTNDIQNIINTFGVGRIPKPSVKDFIMKRANELGANYLIPARWKRSEGLTEGKKIVKEEISNNNEPEIISKLRKIVSDHQHQDIKDNITGNKIRVDVTTASLITQVYDALGNDNKTDFISKGLKSMQNIAYKIFKKNENLNKINETEEEEVKKRVEKEESYMRKYNEIHGVKNESFIKEEISYKQRKDLIGKNVIISPENDNENYDEYRDVVLTITDAGVGGRAYDEGVYPDALCDLIVAKTGEEFPFSLYEYEFVETNLTESEETSQQKNKFNPNQEKLPQIKRELYDMFIETSVGANKHFQKIKIDKIVDRLAEAWDVDLSKIQEELDLGSEIEKEHTKDNDLLAQVIALQHIVEEVDYYTNNKPEGWAEKELGREEAEHALGEGFDPFDNKERILSLFTTNQNKK